jgi:ATP-binding cassette, subfamily F, member 3
MILLQVNQLCKSFGANLILSNIKLEIQSNDRVAIVGRNGAGKSTLLKIIIGDLSYDSGDIIFPKDRTMGYLAQDTGLESSLTIWDEMLTVFQHLKKLEKEISNLESKMGDATIIQNEVEYSKLLKTYDQLQVEYQNQGGYQYENDIRTVLHGLQFHSMDYATPISSLSGGQKTRLALGKLLLTKPDLLVLDEPTNHLDIDTLAWLEQYLTSYSGSILIVSHDRYFLDKVSTKVYEISRNTSTKFLGNYSAYLRQKAEQYEQEMKEFKKQQDEIDKLRDFVQRNLARASTTKRAQSRRKQLERMDIKDLPQGDEKSASFTFAINKQTGNDVLKVEALAIGYEAEQPLASNLNLYIQRAESVALVGPNGVGKSTLLKTIIRELDPLHGQVTYGSNVQIGYYDQEQAKLTSNKTVLQELWDEYPLKPEKDIRTVLGNFLFSGDDVLKGVNDLSGGQKARLALAKLMLQNANVLILDEPTNHLDLDSKEVLENALVDYPGTIIFVSHDRYFINRIATRVVELSSTGIQNFLGDYDYYLAKLDEQAEIARLEAEKLQIPEQTADNPASLSQFELEKQAKRNDRKRLRRIEEIETKIQELESKVEENEALLCDPAYFHNHEKAHQLNQELESLKTEVDALMQEWEELQS